MSSELAERIKQAVKESIKARNNYTDKITADLTISLKQTRDKVAGAILKYRTLGSLPDNKLAALNGLEKLQLEIAGIMKQLKQEHTLLFKQSTNKACRLGIGHGISELAKASLPFYKDLTNDGIDKLTTKVFTLIDTNALDFLAQYNLTLAGDVQRELTDGIRRVLLQGIMDGKGTDEIVRNLGQVIVDKESFRQAGSRVFNKAQYRMEMIARTEIIRAHSMGRLKFHQNIGIKELEWLAMADERSCPVCGGYDGKVFPIKKFPAQPAHPFCRCTNLPVISNYKYQLFIAEDKDLHQKI